LSIVLLLRRLEVAFEGERPSVSSLMSWRQHSRDCRMRTDVYIACFHQPNRHRSASRDKWNRKGIRSNGSDSDLEHPHLKHDDDSGRKSESSEKQNKQRVSKISDKFPRAQLAAGQSQKRPSGCRLCPDATSATSPRRLALQDLTKRLRPDGTNDTQGRAW